MPLLGVEAITVAPNVNQRAIPVRSTPNSNIASPPTAYTVTTSSTEAIKANQNRKGLVLVNTSSNNISLGFGSDAILNSGITLLTGTSFVMDAFSFSTAAIYVISSGSSNLAIQEFI